MNGERRQEGENVKGRGALKSVEKEKEKEKTKDQEEEGDGGDGNKGRVFSSFCLVASNPGFWTLLPPFFLFFFSFLFLFSSLRSFSLLLACPCVCVRFTLLLRGTKGQCVNPTDQEEEKEDTSTSFGEEETDGGNVGT